MDKIEALRKEVIKIGEEIETLELVRNNILSYISVEKIRLLIDDFAKTKREEEKE